MFVNTLTVYCIGTTCSRVWGRGGGIYRNGGALPNNRPIVQYLVSEGPDRLSVYVHIYAVYMYIIYICIYCIILVNKGGTSHTTTIMNSWEYQLTNQIFQSKITKVSLLANIIANMLQFLWLPTRHVIRLPSKQVPLAASTVVSLVFNPTVSLWVSKRQGFPRPSTLTIVLSCAWWLNGKRTRQWRPWVLQIQVMLSYLDLNPTFHCYWFII